MALKKVNKAEITILAYAVSPTGILSPVVTCTQQGKTLKHNHQEGTPVFGKSEYSILCKSPGILVERRDARGFIWVLFQKGWEYRGLVHAISIVNNALTSSITSSMKSIERALGNSTLATTKGSPEE